MCRGTWRMLGRREEGWNSHLSLLWQRGPRGFSPPYSTLNSNHQEERASEPGASPTCGANFDLRIPDTLPKAPRRGVTLGSWMVLKRGDHRTLAVTTPPTQKWGKKTRFRPARAPSIPAAARCPGALQKDTRILTSPSYRPGTGTGWNQFPAYPARTAGG